MHGKQDSRYPSSQVNPYFPQIFRHFSYQRHSQGPAELYGLDIRANGFSIMASKAFSQSRTGSTPLSDLKKRTSRIGVFMDDRKPTPYLGQVLSHRFGHRLGNGFQRQFLPSFRFTHRVIS
jgi:hypothetical protein